MPKIWRGALTLLALWAAFLALLVLTALIPKSAAEKNIKDAAAYYRTTDMFELVSPNDKASVVHNYADAVWLNILWCQDSAHPLRSVLDGSFYQDREQTQGQNLSDAVSGKAANTSYARYWHGILIFLKPLFCVFSLAQVKWVGAAFLILLAAAYFALLLRRRLWAAAIGSAVGLALTTVWLVPMCFEYYACFALMFLFADLALWRGEKLEGPLLFLFSGALVCYFDFLTCEILTLCVPLICLLLVKNEDGKRSLKRAALCCAAWLAAYALTWACKWGLSAAFLGRSLSDVALGQGAYRAVGAAAADVDYGFQPLAAIIVNLYCMFPFQLLSGANAIWVVFGAVCLGLFCFWFLFRRAPGETGPAPALFLLAAAPFVRYFLISNHSALHPFFTFRDLFITILAVSCAMPLAVRCRRKKPPKKAVGKR
jgi:hypothetical protein